MGCYRLRDGAFSMLVGPVRLSLLVIFVWRYCISNPAPLGVATGRFVSPGLGMAKEPSQTLSYQLGGLSSDFRPRGLKGPKGVTYRSQNLEDKVAN